MKRNRIFLPVALLAGVFLFAAACSDDDSNGPCNNDGVCGTGETFGNCPNDCPCNLDGVCDSPRENAVNCCDDCCVSCNINTMSGTNYDYIVSEVYVPDTSAAAADNGVDLDGDGTIDNKIGSILTLVAQQGGDFDVNQELNDALAEGSVILLGRLVVDAFPDDDVVAAQIFQGEVYNDATPIFDGNDQALIGADSPMDIYLCGVLDGGELTAGPSNLTISFPIPEIGLLSITLSQAQLIGDVTETLWTDVMVGGGISKDEIETNLYPTVLDFLNEEIAADPTGDLAGIVVDLLDGACEPTIEGCENEVPGEGECDDTADPPVISLTELICNPLLNSALAPDVDIDGDGENDLISLGLRVVEAVPVEIMN